MSQASAEFDQEVLNDLSDYFHGAPIGLKTTGPDGAITRTNLAELKMLGYEDNDSEYLGRHIAEFHTDPDAVRDLLDRVVGGERVAEREATLLRRDGTLQKVLVYANAKTEAGEFRGMRCFTFPHPDDLRPDIAEAGALTDQSVDSRGLELSSEAKQEMYRELRDFFDNSPVNLHIVGGDGLIKYASNSELASMGYEREDYIGQHIARFHADQAVIDGMLEDLVGGTPLVNFGATLFGGDGNKIPVMIYSNSRMRGGSFLNTRCFTVSTPQSRKAPAGGALDFSWPRNEDFGFAPASGAAPAGPTNPMTLALKYIASRKRPEETLGFLAHVSRALASTAPLHASLAQVASLAVPFLADVVSVDGPDRNLAVASVPSMRGKIDDVLRFLRSGGAEDRFGLERAILSGTGDVCLDLAAEVTGSPGRAGRLRGYGVGSAIIAPLAVRGRCLGALTLLREDSETRRNLGPADEALAEELARRIAFAIEVHQLSGG